MQIAGYSIRFFEGGHLWLDGGAMFGVVPRTMWQEIAPPDGYNRVRLGCTCLLAEGHGRRVLIETGSGDKWSDREAALYGVEDRGGILAALRAGGVEPDSIDTVVCTHLHFDHGGGLTTHGKPRPAVGGECPQPGAAVLQACLSFPNAKVYVQRREWQDAQANRSHMRITYRPENIQPLADAGVVVPIDGAAEVLAGIRVEPAPGHTPGSQAVFIGEGPGAICFPGDVMPTRYHARPYWTMAYDSEPGVVNETRARLVGRAIDAGWIVVMTHDSQPIRISRDEKGRWQSRPA